MARPRLIDAKTCPHCGKPVYRHSARELLCDVGRALAKAERHEQKRAHYDQHDQSYRAFAAATEGAFQALLDLRYLALAMAGECRSEQCIERNVAALRTRLERELRTAEERATQVVRAVGVHDETETSFRHRCDRGAIDADWQPPEAQP